MTRQPRSAPRAVRGAPRWTRCLAALLALLCFRAAHAQQAAPEGNAHPQAALLSDGAFASPFGELVIAPSSSATPEQRHAFAKALDLEALSRLAVHHKGSRVKVVDTMAREVVTAIVGRSAYRDAVERDGKVVELRYDPVFTWLDLLIDPAYYADKPLLHVEFLPLREAVLERAFPADTNARERWKRLTRISPIMAGRALPELQAELGLQPGYQESFANLQRASMLIQRGGANLLLLPPESRADVWHHLAEAPESSGIPAAAQDLGAAWRELDAQRANEALSRLTTAVRTINPDLYPASRAALEHAYNRANAFEWGAWMYLVSMVALLLAVATGRRWLGVVGIAWLALALLAHAGGFAIRCIIADRFAIQNQFESMTGLSLFAVLVGAALMTLRRQWLFGAAAAMAGFLTLIGATQTGVPGAEIEPEAAILNTSVLLKYHVTTVLTSYGLITLGFGCSLFYLWTHYTRRAPATPTASAANPAAATPPGSRASSSSDAPTMPTRARVLADLDAAQMTVLQLAFWTLGVGILLGAWWADHSWGRWWAFDPKETWAMITWIVYLIALHVRLAGVRDKGLVTAWLSTIGFGIMLFTYFGVNLLLPGLHAYA